MILQKLNRCRLMPLLNGAAALVFVLSINGCGVIKSLEAGQENQDGDPDNKFDFIERQCEQSFAQRTDNHSATLDQAAPANNTAVKKAIQSRLRPDKAPKDDGVRVRQPAPPFYEDLILLDADEELDVSMVFNSTPLVDTLPAFADILGFNFTSDSDIKSTVTLNLNSRMTRRELWENFDSMLKIAGVSAVRNGQLLNIMPITKIPQQAALRVGNRYDGGSEVICRQMTAVVSRDAINMLRQFLTKSGVIVDVAKTNSILVSDTAANMPKIKEILDLVDQPGRRAWPRTVIYCHNVKPSKMAQELSEILPVLGFPISLITDRSESPGSIQLTSVDRLQVLIASAATAEAIKEVVAWADILDNSDASDQERLYIYKVAHGKARQLAQALTAIFATQGTAMSVDSGTGNQRNESLNAQATRQLNQVSTPQSRYSTNNMTATQVDKTSSVFDTPLRLFADGVQNRLVIRTTPRTYALVKAMLDRLDVVPAQVLLQIMIVEVSLNDSNSFGIDFNNVQYSNGTGISTGTNFNNSGRLNSPESGFTMSIFNEGDPNDKFASLHALAGRNNVKIISSPQLVVTSNTEAHIEVGARVPLLSSDYTNTQSSGSTQRSYEYTDTGVILEITPQVTSSDLIALELSQTISEAVSNTITSATHTPVINQRILTTNMTITNGHTMVIGGMIQEKKKDYLNSVPVISDIPMLRRLLGSTAQSVERTELLVLITGYIINEKSPVEDMLRRYNQSVKAISTFENQLEEEHARDLERYRQSRARIQEIREENDREQQRQGSPVDGDSGNAVAAAAVTGAEEVKPAAAPAAAPAEQKK